MSIPRTPATLSDGLCFQFSSLGWLQCPGLSAFSERKKQQCLTVQNKHCHVFSQLTKYMMHSWLFSPIRNEQLNFSNSHCFPSPQWPQCRCDSDRVLSGSQGSADPQFLWSGYSENKCTDTYLHMFKYMRPFFKDNHCNQWWRYVWDYLNA